MKRLSIFFAALFVAVSSFAAVTSELNGGVTNDYGWASKSEMFKAFTEDGGLTGMQTLEEYMAMTDPYTPYCGKLTVQHMQTAFAIEDGAKWGWLKAYLQKIHAEQTADGASALDDAVTAAAWRFSVTAFFVEGQRTSWPKSANFAQAGKLAAYQPTWKHGFVNPTEPTEKVALNAPYFEGESFLGWYWEADFSGAKVDSIDATSTGTLYAKHGEYIPTIKEVHAMADDTETKTAGVVNFISGNNIYIQDASAGILVYTSATPECKVGDNIVVKGLKVMYGGAPEVKNAVIESAEKGVKAAPTVLETLAPLVSDSLEHKYFATNVKIAGVKIVEYDSYNNPTVQDALGNKAKCYKMVLDPAAYPVGTKVIVNAVAGWYKGFQFVGNSSDITVAIAGVKDPYNYPVISDGRYTLTNNWVISSTMDNYEANKPGSNDYVRGMAAKDGIMYFINRETKSIVRVDGKTGDMLDPIVLKGDHLFQKVSKVDTIDGVATPVYADATTLAYNDIKFDQAGNCLIGCCISAASACQPFMIYTVDLTTGECTELINDNLWDNPGLDSIKFRFDAFGVAGDVTKNGVVMAADANGSWDVFRWIIQDGKAAEGEKVSVTIDPAVDKSLYVKAAGYGTAPQIFPQNAKGNLFYVDGFNTLPMLFYSSGNEANLIDDFINVPTGVSAGRNGEVITMNANFNGLIEFQVGEEYYLLMVAANNTHNVPTTYGLFKFADADRAFEGLTPLWYFPHAGLGANTIGCRTAVPSVDVVSDTEATLYLYATNNGYASYTFKIDPDKKDYIAGVEEIEAVVVEAKKIMENGNIFVIKNGVKYNMLGAEVK